MNATVPARCFYGRLPKGSGMTVILAPGRLTTCPALILAVLRDSACPSTWTRPSATMLLASPPLLARLQALMSLSSVMYSPRSSKVICCRAGILRHVKPREGELRVCGLLQRAESVHNRAIVHTGVFKPAGVTVQFG